MSRPADYGALLDALRGVSWPSRNPARGVSSGSHRSRLRGISPEFTEYRPYRQGDDPRRLDWKLLARTDRAYLRLTSDRATLGTVVVVDASGSMAFPLDGHEKWVRACEIAVGLLAVAHAAGDPVGLVVPTPARVHVLGPLARWSVVAEAARLLSAIEPAGATDLGPAVRAVRTHHRVAIISDFLSFDDAARSLVRVARERSAAGADVSAVHVIAREEIAPRQAAMLAFDPEHPEVKRPLTDATIAGYRAAFDTWRTELAREWRQAGASYAEVVTDEPAAHAVRRIVGSGRSMAEQA
ncbi:MAG TPA: DUF58 domain-containing protein [Gemmatimonadaceae bacterium]|nr:DUF58 domain-containing protein [Gemmatimonadaceae bacterium]